MGNTGLPLFSEYFTSIDMVIFFTGLVVSAVFARFRPIIVARLWCAMIVRRLVLATKVALIVLIVIVRVFALPIVVVSIAAARLAIFRIVAALLAGVLCLVTVDMARFTGELRRSFSLGLVTFKVLIARRFVAAIVIAIVGIITTA